MSVENAVSKTDVIPTDFENAYQLSASGTVSPTVYLTTTVVSTTSGTKTVVINLPSNGEGIMTGADNYVEVGDLVVLSGTSGGAADGTYNVASVLSDTSFTTVQAIASSTGGSVNFQYPAGAIKVGVDPTGFTYVTHTTVQAALKDLDSSISATGTPYYDFLLENDPAEPTNNYSNAYNGSKVTSETWQNSSNSHDIKTINYTYSGSQVTQEVRKVYASDGVTVVAELTIAYSYTGNRILSATITRNI